MVPGDKYLMGMMWKPETNSLHIITFHEDEIGTIYEEDTSEEFAGFNCTPENKISVGIVIRRIE